MLLSAHEIVNTADRQEIVDGILRRNDQFRQITVARDIPDVRYRFNRLCLGSVRVGVSRASSVQYVMREAQDVVLTFGLSGTETIHCGAEGRSLLTTPSFLPRRPGQGEVIQASFVTVRLSRGRLVEHLAEQGWRGDLGDWIDRWWLTRLPDSDVVGAFLTYALGRLDRYGVPKPAEARALEELFYVHAGQLVLADGDEAAPRHSSRSFRRCVDYIEAHLTDDLPLMSVAAAAGLSVRSVQLLFKRHAGENFSRFLLQRRLLRAREALLLGRSEARVQDIARAAGFHSMSHFTRSYRQAFGEMPSRTSRLPD